MKRLLSFITTALFLPAIALAGPTPLAVTPPTPVASIKFDAAAGKIIGGATSFSIRNAADDSDNMICTDAGVCTVRGGVTVTAGDVAVTAGDVTFGTAGKYVKMAVYVPTMAATPVAGTNQVLPGLNVVPTAAANTAAFIGAATPVPGQHFIVNNSGPNAIRLKASGGATLNGATAGGYVVVATLATVECVTASATNQICTQPVIPTPAGP